jgi:hypothetical protein
MDRRLGGSGEGRTLRVAAAAIAIAGAQVVLAGDEIFSDGFFSGECSLWSATSNPPGAPDVDEDGFGNELEPAPYCELPDGWAADVTDCDDLDSDVYPDAPELCDGLDQDCDDLIDEDFVANTDPSCDGASSLGEVSGDASSFLSTSGYQEAWYVFTVDETSADEIPLTARIDLESQAGTDFDLYVYCLSCGGSPMGESTLSGEFGHTDSVEIDANDLGVGSSFQVLVEVRYSWSNRCADWTLSVTGGATVFNGLNCNT